MIGFRCNRYAIVNIMILLVKSGAPGVTRTPGKRFRNRSSSWISWHNMVTRNVLCSMPLIVNNPHSLNMKKLFGQPTFVPGFGIDLHAMNDRVLLSSPGRKNPGTGMSPGYSTQLCIQQTMTSQFFGSCPCSYIFLLAYLNSNLTGFHRPRDTWPSA